MYVLCAYRIDNSALVTNTCLFKLGRMYTAMRPLALALACLALFARAQNPTIELRDGKLQGAFLKSDKGTYCQAYYGIPFAQPPIGELRFRKPVPVRRWQGVRDASGPYNICVSMPWGAEVPPNESEDCLQLHVVTAANAAPDDHRPVIVWIHGGGFVAARSTFTGEVACEQFVSRDVVLVAIQYRVGYLGFMATGDDEAKGNYGLYDQLAALKWINENIVRFGGDPQRVTVAGSSAGGASASFLSYVKEAENLVHRTISQSGSPFAFWAFNHRSEKSFPKLSEAAECGDESVSTKERLECLRTKPLELLQNAHFEQFGIESYARRRKERVEYQGGGHDWFNIISFNWSPRIDGELITGKPHKMISRLRKQKATITGVTNSECLLFAKTWQFWPPLWAVTEKYRNYSIPYYIENDDDFDVDNFEKALKTALDIYADPMAYHPDETSERDEKVLYDFAKAIYLNQEGETTPDATTQERHIQQMIQVCGDFWMNIPCVLDAETKARRQWDVFVYNLDFVHENYPEEYPEIWKGSTHDDICKFIWVPDSPKQREMRDLILTLWTNFAIYAHPTPFPEKTGFKWPKFDSLTNPTHLKLGLKPEKKQHFHDPSVPFWTLLAPKIKHTSRAKTEL